VVTIPPVGVARTTSSNRPTLRRVLKRADYATSKMQAAEGPDHDEEMMVIRRIKAGTISLNDYPESRSHQKRADRDALASWENEGGATGSAGKVPKTTESHNDWRSDLARTDQFYRSASDPDQTTIRSKAITEEEKSDRTEKTSRLRRERLLCQGSVLPSRP
jgi:hypothetical protein